MSSVFGHGRLRLYLLKLLDEEPRHGYDVIRLLKDRFMGVYAPSAGTIYPRLTRLEEEGLVEHEEVEGRKVYHVTEAGRRELAQRGDELAALEQDLARSVHELAREVREDVRSSVRSLREELKEAAREARADDRADTRADDRTRRGSSGPSGHGPWSPGWDPFDGDVPGRDEAREAMRQAKEALREAARQAKRGARRAKDKGDGWDWGASWSGSWGSDWQGAWEASWDKAREAQDDVRGQLVVLAEQLRRELRLAVRAGLDDDAVGRVRAGVEAALETVREVRRRG